jgi:hypothetical protein
MEQQINPEVPTPPPSAPVEAPKAAPEAPKEEPKPISREFQVLARKEQALQREREKLKAELQSFEAEKARIADLEKRYGQKPKSPLEALERYGFTYKDATDFELNDNQPTAEHLARQAIERANQLEKSFEEREADRVKKAAEEQQTAYQAYLEEFKGAISEFVTKNSDDFELTKLFNAEPLIYNTIESYFAEHKKVLSIKEAADLVEKHCEELMEGYRASKKFKTHTAPKPADKASPKDQEPQSRRTMNNDQFTSSTPTLVSSPKVEEDRIKRALAALG